jgi:membrane protein
MSETAEGFSRDRADLAAAALAFFTMLSLAPLILIAVGVAGIFLGEAAARTEVQHLLARTMGGIAAGTVDRWVSQAGAGGPFASAVGLGLMVWTASRLARQLRESLNLVWNVDVAAAAGFKAAVQAYVSRRLFAFGVVLASGPLLLLVVISRTALTALEEVLFPRSIFEAGLAEALQICFSVTLVAAVCTLIFRFVPDTRVGWTPCARGGLLTSAAFNAGNYLVGLYLGTAGTSQVYGLAGSLVVVLLWLYYSAQIFLLGAEFTQAYTRHYGRSLNRKERHELKLSQRARDHASPR